MGDDVWAESEPGVLSCPVWADVCPRCGSFAVGLGESDSRKVPVCLCDTPAPSSRVVSGGCVA